MPLKDRVEASQAALWSAKSTFGTLSILKKYFGNDLDMAKVAFTLALRTRPDYFLTELRSEHYEDETINDIYSDSFCATIYELAKFSEIDRATVRRKLYKLQSLGFVEKLENDLWSLTDFRKKNNEAAELTLESLFGLYINQVKSILEIFSISDISRMHDDFSHLPEININALNGDEVRRKIKRGMKVEKAEN